MHVEIFNYLYLDVAKISSILIYSTAVAPLNYSTEINIIYIACECNWDWAFKVDCNVGQLESCCCCCEAVSMSFIHNTCCICLSVSRR